MERAAWTDERLDDLAVAMRNGFERVDGDLRGIRGEMGALRGEMGALRGEMGALRVEMREEVGSLRSEIGDLRHTLNRFGGGMMIGLIGVIAAILAHG